MKKILFIFLFIFLTTKIYAASLTVSPEQVNFELNQGETICKKINLDGNGIILIKDKWAEKWEDQKELNLHKLNSNELNININYPKNISINGREKIEICINSEEFGKYHGILLFREENSKSGIGIWLNVTVKKDEFFSKITGALINSEKEKLDKVNLMVIFTFILLLFLAFVLIILIRKTI